MVGFVNECNETKYYLMLIVWALSSTNTLQEATFCQIKLYLGIFPYKNLALSDKLCNTSILGYISIYH